MQSAWVVNKVYDYGLPYDFYITRASTYLHGLAPGVFSWLIERKLQKRFDHELYGSKPAHKFHEAGCALSDDLPGRMLTGEVIVKTIIRSFEGEYVIEFQDGSRVDQIDAVILCTGYRFELPLLENGKLAPVCNNDMNLYKYIFRRARATTTTSVLSGKSR